MCRSNVIWCMQCHLVYTMLFGVYNVIWCIQCHLVYAMLFGVYNVIYRCGCYQQEHKIRVK
jgi:hypothetical protein